MARPSSQGRGFPSSGHLQGQARACLGARAGQGKSPRCGQSRSSGCVTPWYLLPGQEGTGEPTATTPRLQIEVGGVWVGVSNPQSSCSPKHPPMCSQLQATAGEGGAHLSPGSSGSDPLCPSPCALTPSLARANSLLGSCSTTPRTKPHRASSTITIQLLLGWDEAVQKPSWERHGRRAPQRHPGRVSKLYWSVREHNSPPRGHTACTRMCP